MTKILTLKIILNLKYENKYVRSQKESPMPTEILYFKYHLDPIKIGHATTIDFNCHCCHYPSDYAYARHKDLICFECIKSGAAVEKFDMKFTWFDSNSDKIDLSEIEELEKRTPGYIGLDPINRSKG